MFWRRARIIGSHQLPSLMRSVPTTKPCQAKGAIKVKVSSQPTLSLSQVTFFTLKQKHADLAVSGLSQTDAATYPDLVPRYTELIRGTRPGVHGAPRSTPCLDVMSGDLAVLGPANSLRPSAEGFHKYLASKALVNELRSRAECE
jgi:hypothetical protein